jgi:hypothetical protein
MNSTTTNKCFNPAWKMNMLREEKDDFDRIEKIMQLCEERGEILDFAQVRESADNLRRNYLKRVGQRLLRETGT